MKKVLLVSMPFGALERPALGLSLLKARLAESDILCDVRYLTFPFAEFIGYDDYQWMLCDVPYTTFAGDWVFRQSLYGEPLESETGFIQQVLRDTWHLEESDIGRVLHVRSMAQHFLDHCMAAVRWEDYAVVGFTSTFQQNLASLALAARLKAASPGITTVFGGANWEAPMGVELHRRFSCVDYVCSGEAEQSFPALVQGLFGDEAARRRIGTIPGLIYRSGGDSKYSGPAELVPHMDALPIPDFSDYFRDLAQSTIGALVAPILLFETSRGCWWGAKSHCTFCGLNGGSMSFRSKSARRALDELEYLVDHWRIDLVEVVDNILDMKYFGDMLPALACAKRPLRLFYEVKSNLNRQQVRTLREAGIYRIQPGIESLNDHVLTLMRKGTTALRNIQLLKWCKEYQVGVDWNMLYGFPGETPEDYASTMALLPSIRFLQPPTAWGPVRLDRFSPYHTSPDEFGIVNVRPLAPYAYLYPFDAESLSRVAYYFDYEQRSASDPETHAAEVIQYVQAWQQQPERGTLCSIVRPDGALALIDTRSDACLPEIRLSGLERAAYEYCDEVRSGKSVARHLKSLFPNEPCTEQQVLDFLDSVVSNRLMVTDGVHYLSLALSTQPYEAPSEHDAFLTDADAASMPRKPASSYLRKELPLICA